MENPIITIQNINSSIPHGEIELFNDCSDIIQGLKDIFTNTMPFQPTDEPICSVITMASY